MDREMIVKCFEFCRVEDKCSTDCPYWDNNSSARECTKELAKDVLTLLKQQDEEHRRLLSWLGKFCRHIDNGDAWLTDEENIAFFKEKMKQQFGWDTD